jgi:hypothetical protein
MLQLQGDQAQPNPKKRRMTFAEWRATNPPPDPESEKRIQEMCEFVRTVLVPAFQEFLDEDQQQRAEESNSPSQNQTEEK